MENKVILYVSLAIMVSLLNSSQLLCQEGPSVKHYELNHYFSEDCKGEIKLSASGYPPHTFVWSNGDIGPEINNLDIGEYTVTVTDNICGEAIHTFEIINVVNLIEINGASSCDRDDLNIGTSCNGSIIIGTTETGLSFSWTSTLGGSDIVYTNNNQNITDLCFGLYHLTVTNSMGCSASHTFKVCCCNENIGGGVEGDSGFGVTAQFIYNCFQEGEVSNLSISYYEIHPPSDEEELNGIKIWVSGGTQDYLYTWYDPNGNIISFNEDLISSNLDLGEYCVVVSDGCDIVEQCFVIRECESPSSVLDPVIENPCTYTNENNQEIIRTGSIDYGIGTESAFNYTWSNGATGAINEDLLSTTYHVTITDKSTQCKYYYSHRLQSEYSTDINTDYEYGSIRCVVREWCQGEIVNKFPSKADIELLNSDPNSPCLARFYCPYSGSYIGDVFEGTLICDNKFLTLPDNVGNCLTECYCDYSNILHPDVEVKTIPLIVSHPCCDPSSISENNYIHYEVQDPYEPIPPNPCMLLAYCDPSLSGPYYNFEDLFLLSQQSAISVTHNCFITNYDCEYDFNNDGIYDYYSLIGQWYDGDCPEELVLLANDIDLLIYPNPSARDINYYSNRNIYEYEIINLFGGKELSEVIEYCNRGVINIDKLTPGIYLFRAVYANNIFIIKKFIKI